MASVTWTQDNNGVKSGEVVVVLANVTLVEALDYLAMKSASHEGRGWVVANGVNQVTMTKTYAGGRDKRRIFAIGL